MRTFTKTWDPIFAVVSGTLVNFLLDSAGSCSAGRSFSTCMYSISGAAGTFVLPTIQAEFARTA